MKYFYLYNQISKLLGNYIFEGILMSFVKFNRAFLINVCISGEFSYTNSIDVKIN